MLREHAKFVERVVIAVDVGLVLLSLFVAAGALGRYSATDLVTRYGVFLVASSVVWYLLLRHAGFYRPLRTRGNWPLFAQVVQTAGLAGVINAALLYLTAPLFSRRLYVAHLLLAFALLLAWKLLLRATQRFVRRRGYNFRRIVVVGTRDAALRFIRHVEEHRDWGYQIVGCIQGTKGTEKPTFCGYPVLGRLDALADICRTQPVDEVIFTLPKEYTEDIEAMLPSLEAMGITTRLALEFYRPLHSRTMFGLLGDDDPIPIATYYRMTLDPTQLFLKRLLDVVGGAAGLAITGAVFSFVALAIKLDSPGPILFRQKRVGRNGRIFSCYKFRTMYADAEARKQELLAKNEMKGAIFKIADDPRITRVGKFLRKTSIDELPQFWNVLSGEMSLVGTRPPTPDEVARYEDWHRARISIKPGLTGMWQTSGRNKIDDFNEICRLDMAYIDNWSLWLDVKIIAKTVAVVLLGVGAR